MANEHSQWEAMIAMAHANNAPMSACLMACVGWLGYYLNKHNNWPPPPKLVGGFLLSTFMAFVLFNLLTQPLGSLWWYVALASLGGPAGAPLCKSLVQKLQGKIDGVKL